MVRPETACHRAAINHHQRRQPPSWPEEPASAAAPPRHTATSNCTCADRQSKPRGLSSAAASATCDEAHEARRHADRHRDRRRRQPELQRPPRDRCTCPCPRCGGVRGSCGGAPRDFATSPSSRAAAAAIRPKSRSTRTTRTLRPTSTADRAPTLCGGVRVELWYSKCQGPILRGSDGTPRSLGRIGPGLHLGTGSNRASSLREPVQRASSSQSGFTPTSVPKQAGVSQASTGA